MRIDGIPVSPLSKVDEHSQAQQERARVSEKQSGSDGRTDRVELSETSRELATSGAREPETARQDRIAEITRLVHSGNYPVDARQVADSILTSHTLPAKE